jgi:hypothetical protein
MFYSAECVEGVFSEVRSTFGPKVPKLVQLSDTPPRIKEYAAFIAWHSLRRVKGQGRHLPSF